MSCNTADFVFSAYLQLLNLKNSQVHEVGEMIPIPQFDKHVVLDLCDLAISVLRSENTLLRLTGDLKIVGDIHGSLHDLLKFFGDGEFDTESRYLFLGDYVDRGPFSLEVINLLLALLVNEPSRYFLLRGNHEFADVATQYGFREEIMGLYNDIDVFSKYMEVFSYLPLAAVVNDELFCVHGGIGPNITLVCQIQAMGRPILDYKHHPCCDLLWADPDKTILRYKESARGVGVEFGSGLTSDFLKMNDLKVIVRAHECVNGVKTCFHNTVVTVFSSSSYNNDYKNQSAILLYGNGGLLPVYFEPRDRVKRRDAYFYNMRQSIALMKKQSSPSLVLSLCGSNPKIKPSRSRRSACLSPSSSYGSLPKLFKAKSGSQSQSPSPISKMSEML